MIGKYILDGQDMFTAFGFVPMSGKDDFLRLPELKDPYSHDWKDKSGLEYDLSNPVFKTRTGTLKGHIQASSLADFTAKHSALFEALKAPGIHTLTIGSFNQTFQVFYRSNPGVNSYDKPFKNADEIWLYLELVFEITGGGYLDEGLGNYYFGAVSAVPASWEDVENLAGFQQEGAGSLIDLNTGTVNSTFIFVCRTAKSIKRVLDLNASNEDLTNLYSFYDPITSPGGVSYQIYKMENALPYSTNHIHQFQMN